MDLDSLYVSSIVLLIGPVIDELHFKGDTPWPQRRLALLEYMESSGNLIAGWGKSDVRQLDELVNELHDNRTKDPDSSDVTCTAADFPATLAPENPSFNQELYSLQRFSMNTIGTGEDLTADQILAIASSIQEEDAEWMDRAILENHIW
jgi:proline utilization trans-activator